MAKKKVPLSEVVKTKDKESHDRLYSDYVKSVTPVNNKWVNLVYAYVIGGIICIIGQAFTDLYMGWGLDKEMAKLATTVSLVFIAVILTGLNLYQKLAKIAGGGSLVPITGFANSVAAPAIEFQKEGQVFGIGSKIFTIAGPVILYGIVVSWVLGLVYWVYKLLN